MKPIVIAILLLIFNLNVNGQTVKRYSQETAEQFVNRIRPDSLKVAHTVIETNTWTTNEKVIIAFLGYDAPNDGNLGFNTITGYLFFPLSPDSYKTIKLSPIDEDGGFPEVISVFFTNADDDKERELGVLCEFWQNHYDYSGNLYKAFIYDNPTKEKDNLGYDEKLLNKFWGCDCDFRESPSRKASFKTAKDVKDELKRMGY